MPYRDPEKKLQYDRQYYHQKHDAIEPRKPGPKGPRLQDDQRRVLVSFRLPIQLLARLDQLIAEAHATHNRPYKTRTALASFLLLRGFESLKGDPTVDEMLPYLKMIEGVDVFRFHRTEAQAAYSRITTEVAELMEIGATDQAKNCLHGALAGLEEMSPNVWRDSILKRLREEFSDLLRRQTKTVSFASGGRR